jgi:hypothetical protein
MPGTRRMPLNRKQRQAPYSDRALDLFEEMSKLACTCSAATIRNLNCHRAGEGCPGCVRWWELRPTLRRTLGGRVWEEFYIISRHPPDRRRSWPADSEEGRWLALEKASEARRRARVAATPLRAVQEESASSNDEPQDRRQKRGPSKSGNGAPDTPASP